MLCVGKNMIAMSDHWIFVLRPELCQPSPHQAETDDGIVTTNCVDLPFQPCHLQPYQGPEPGRYLGDWARSPTSCQGAVQVAIGCNTGHTTGDFVSYHTHHL